MAPSKQEILAASAGWVAVSLNVVPGLGAGYLYQRRWEVYWITSGLATTWFVLGAVLGQEAGAAEELQDQLVELGGLVTLAARNGSRGRAGSEESSRSGLSHYPIQQKFRRRGYGGRAVHAHT